MKLFKKIGSPKNTKNKINFSINLNELKEGINSFDQFFVNKNKEKINIFDKNCDHAGGKLISRNGIIICPMHNWELDINSLTYKNGIKKKQIDFKIKNNSIKFTIEEIIPEISLSKKFNYSDLKISFFNHAFLKVSNKNFSFATDPWAIGSSFANGWWLKNKSRGNWLKEINELDFIYISHNHPDHLHAETLSKVNKEIPIVVPKFQTDSTGVLIEDLGFKNVIRLEFNTEYKLNNSDLILILLKSGDFREDSGIYFSVHDFKLLFDVDSNNINFGRFPKADVYATSFSSGASGYPLMFDNYNKDEKQKILNTNKNFTKRIKEKALLSTKTKYFLPYASFFVEKAVRDKEIYDHNVKIKIRDYEKFCKNNKIIILDTEKYNEFKFKKKKLFKEKIDIVETNLENVEQKINIFKSKYDEIDEEYIKDYFVSSKFNEKLDLFISLTDDNFKINGNNYYVNFSKTSIIFKNLKKNELAKIYNKKNSNRKLHIKARKESFLYIVYNKLPWEDLLIGFQCKILRSPNIYNARFWYHFTNVYISKKFVRASLNCDSCKFISQKFDDDMYGNK
jgi:CMP-N-acetylneuraminate monooxygenase